jgi:predicted Rossmann-fold nucleotide-binding protein
MIYERCDAAIGFASGCGTLDEVFEMLEPAKIHIRRFFV